MRLPFLAVLSFLTVFFCSNVVCAQVDTIEHHRIVVYNFYQKCGAKNKSNFWHFRSYHPEDLDRYQTVESRLSSNRIDTTDIRPYDNFIDKKYLGAYIIVLGYENNLENCAVIYFGVGIAPTKSAAIDKAKQDLSHHYKEWTEAMGYNIVEEIQN